MLVLLPPSEGKSPVRRRGRPVEMTELSFPGLALAREEVLDQLVALGGAPDALARLGVGASLAAEVAANAQLRHSPTTPAGGVYTGVLYDALDLSGLDAAARRRAARSVVISSALWGALRLGDRIPPYRLGITADLPGLGPLATWWRPHLRPVLDDLAGRNVIVDCRSSGYAAMWTPTGEAARRWVAVRVLREVDGRRSVVSHLAKLTRGQLTRHLVSAAHSPRTVDQVAELAADAFEVELSPPERAGRAWILDVVLREG